MQDYWNQCTKLTTWIQKSIAPCCQKCTGDPPSGRAVKLQQCATTTKMCARKLIHCMYNIRKCDKIFEGWMNNLKALMSFLINCQLFFREGLPLIRSYIDNIIEYK